MRIVLIICLWASLLTAALPIDAEGTNLIPDYYYRVVYYDGGDKKVATEDRSTDSSGNLSSQHTFQDTEPADESGTWRVLICETTCNPPADYDPGWSCALVSDTFDVQQSAIPEFPSAITTGVVFTSS